MILPISKQRRGGARHGVQVPASLQAVQTCTMVVCVLEATVTRDSVSDDALVRSLDESAEGLIQAEIKDKNPHPWHKMVLKRWCLRLVFDFGVHCVGRFWCLEI